MLLQNSTKLVSVAIAAKSEREKNAKWGKWKNGKNARKLAHSVNQREFVVRLKCAYGISFNYMYIYTFNCIHTNGIVSGLKYLLHIFTARRWIQMNIYMKSQAGTSL